MAPTNMTMIPTHFAILLHPLISRIFALFTPHPCVSNTARNSLIF